MSFTKHLNGVTDEMLKAVQAVYEVKKEEKEDDEFEFVIPEEITKEDQSDFVVAAAAAKKAGKKKFTFQGKEFPVTIKTDIQTESEEGEYPDAEEDEVEVTDNLPESKKMKEEKCEDCGKEPCECEGEADNKIEIDPVVEEKDIVCEDARKAGKDMMAYADKIGKKHMDYADFVKCADMLLSNKERDAIKFAMGMDTDVREKMLEIIG